MPVDIPRAEIWDHYDGPLNASDAIYEWDNATVFYGEGLPYRIGVLRQDGAVLTLHDGSRVRIQSWPLSKAGCSGPPTE